MKFPNKVYDILKWLCLVVINGCGVFYNKLAEIWSLPYGDEVLKTCAAVAFFIGALIGVSTAEYNKDKDKEE